MGPQSGTGQQNILYDLTFQYESPRYKTLGDISVDADADGDGYSQRGDGVLRVNHTGAPREGGRQNKMESEERKLVGI